MKKRRYIIRKTEKKNFTLFDVLLVCCRAVAIDLIWPSSACVCVFVHHLFRCVYRKLITCAQWLYDNAPCLDTLGVALGNIALLINLSDFA